MIGQEDTQPFLRWVGGKRHLVERLRRLVPRDAEERKYHEPFLGAGSMFFALQPRTAVLGDANARLIECYTAVRQRPQLVARYLAAHAAQHGKRYYYRVRRQYNEGGAPAVQAARFMYLNSACFNGVFRVNTSGDYNVPVGRKKRLRVPTSAALSRIASVLSRARLTAGSYESSLAAVGPDDFVYLDPPYPPLNGTSYFTHYTLDRFTSEDQCQLAEYVRALHQRGALFLMTNADTASIRHLYAKFTLTPLEVTRWVSCKAVRYRVSELVITNYLSNGGQE